MMNLRGYPNKKIVTTVENHAKNFINAFPQNIL